jgi:hypothetical protein
MLLWDFYIALRIPQKLDRLWLKLYTVMTIKLRINTVFDRTHPRRNVRYGRVPGDA